MDRELNNLTTEKVDIETYFDVMDITEEQKEERREVADDIWWLLMLLFAMFKSGIEDGSLEYDSLVAIFTSMYAGIVAKYAEQDDYINAYVNQVPEQIVETTWNHIDFEEPDNYWLSDERAVGIAVNEANTIKNYADIQKAAAEGMNVKIWHTQRDSHVRKTHSEIEGQEVGLWEMFKVGATELMFPRDEVNCTDVREIANCRCYAKAEYDPKYESKGLHSKDLHGRIKEQTKNFHNDNGGFANPSQFKLKKAKGHKVPKSDPLWDSLVQGDVETQLEDVVFPWEFGGYKYYIEIIERYEYRIISKYKMKNIHE